MNAHEEQIERLVIKRRDRIGNLSAEGCHELELAVRQDPASFVDDNAEKAFSVLMKGLDAYNDSVKDDDLRDDDAYDEERGHRIGRLASACQRALAYDPNCVDAQLMMALLGDSGAEDHFEKISALDEKLTKSEGTLTAGATGNAWANVFARPRLRVAAALSRSCIDTARYGMAQTKCLTLLEVAPFDELGARYTLSLAAARLEDEERFNWLDARFSHHGNAWFHLARVILMYKLGRMSAARRALRGFDQLCLGGAYTLLQPFFVDTYLPDRPDFEPGSYDEVVYAVHEADPIIADMPEFVSWASAQPGIMASARDFAERNGFDWRDNA